MERKRWLFRLGIGVLLAGCSGASNNEKANSPSAGGSTGSSGGTGSSGSSASNPVDGVTVTVAPSVVHLRPAATANFIATVGGATDKSVTWSVQEGKSGGAITTDGVYTAPAASGTFHVIAASTAKPAATATATVIVTTVGNCDNLPAPGKWETIAPVTAVIGDSAGKNYTESIIVDPFDPATVWLGTGFAGVFKSPDCGATWMKVSTGRNSDKMDNGSHASMALDPVDRGTMYAVSLFGAFGLWKTTNAGVDWDQILLPDTDFYKATNNFVDAVAMDPTDHLHLVLGMHTNCTAPYAPTCTGETFDGGKTWQVVKLPTPAWEEGAGPAIIGGKLWTYGGQDLWVTTDDGATWNKATPQGTSRFDSGETTTRPIVQTADGTYLLTSNDGFVMSKDGIAWSRVPNFTNRLVPLALAGGHLYAADQWSKSFYSALETDLSTWTTVPPMADLPDNEGAPYIDYDSVHHVLYTGHYAGGMWRLVTE
jgi:hypothetical protein